MSVGGGVGAGGGARPSSIVDNSKVKWVRFHQQSGANLFLPCSGCDVGRGGNTRISARGTKAHVRIQRGGTKVDGCVTQGQFAIAIPASTAATAAYSATGIEHSAELVIRPGHLWRWSDRLWRRRTRDLEAPPSDQLPVLAHICISTGSRCEVGERYRYQLSEMELVAVAIGAEVE